MLYKNYISKTALQHSFTNQFVFRRNFISVQILGRDNLKKKPSVQKMVKHILSCSIEC